MAWVDLSGSFSYGSTLTSTQMQNLRDNISAMASGASGAPSIQTAAIANLAVTTAKIANANVTNAKLKTSTGSVTGTIAAGASVNFSLQDYCFHPNYGGAALIYLNTYNSISAVYTARSRIYNDSGGSESYGTYYRYVTASDKPFIYAIKDKDGKIIHCWECDDPPPGYWGLDKMPEGFEPPIIVLDAEKKIVVPDSEICQFNVDKEFIETLRAKAKTDKTLFATELDAYELKDNIFVSKNISEI